MIPEELCQSEFNFLGLPREYTNPEKARVWILPIPFEATTTYGAGTRNGPAAIITASRQVELYDYRRRCTPAYELGFATLPPLEILCDSVQSMMNRITQAITQIFSSPPSPDLLVILGGEHSISAGVARALAALWADRDWVCVQIDAHADLRDQYEGSPFNHACAARRISECCPIFQIGIRNISEEEEHFRSRASHVHTVFHDGWGPAALQSLAEFVRGKTVYLTIDLDGLDPSIMPAVGTPEPGGLSWKQLQDVLKVLAENARRVPVMDVVELAPIPGLIAPDFLAAKMIYWAAADLLLSPCKPPAEG